MSIQSSINKVISLAGVFSKLGGKLAEGKEPEVKEPTSGAPEVEEETVDVEESTANKEATTALTDEQNSKRVARRNFLDYMKSESTSLGGKFGDLSPKLQQLIANAYSEKQKEDIMNRKDAKRDE